MRGTARSSKLIDNQDSILTDNASTKFSNYTRHFRGDRRSRSLLSKSKGYHRSCPDLTQDSSFDDEVYQDRGLRRLGRKTEDMSEGVNKLYTKQDNIMSDFSDFESNLKRIRAGLNSLFSKHQDVNDRLVYSASGGQPTPEQSEQQWAHFQKDNKLLSLAVSKLLHQEGFKDEYQENGTSGENS